MAGLTIDMDATAINYSAKYDRYWRSADQVRELSGSVDRIAEQIMTTCGFGRTLDVGSGEGKLVGELLRLGVDANGVDVSEVATGRSNRRLPGRFTHASVLDLPYDDASFKTVVSIDCMEHLAPEDVPKALTEIYRVSNRFVFLQIATFPDHGEHWRLTIEDRHWWEARCFEAGFRKHPLYYRVNSYESLNREQSQIYVLLEKVPSEALRSYDLNSLAEERLLHNDMLREVGRRSDAHCIRYYKAAELIRPGDRVLDVACGLGYGSHILFSASRAGSILGVDTSEFAIKYASAHYQESESIEFIIGDAQNLEFIPDHSIDFIAAFETIEHVENPIAYLQELKRVLKPAGRVMVCAPNEWVDETGKDPNPHHLHVYTWERLVADVGAFFLLEQGILQVAGGALKCPNGDRSWVEFAVEKSPDTEAEWILLVAMADPVDGKCIPYLETTWSVPDSPEFHVAAFARDYDNPWLVKSLVAMGMRMRSANGLADLQERVLSSAGPESVDYGAALCGRIYAHMGEELLSVTVIRGIESEVMRYAEISEPSPHQQRWQVSLLFAAAELARKQGRFSDASRFYSECAGRDVHQYSPLLGNKTVDSLFWLAKLSLDNNDFEVAKKHLLNSISEVKRLVSGSWVNIVGSFERPLAFGLAEVSQLFDKAARSAYMLAVIDRFGERPYVLAQEAMGFFERHINHYKAWGVDLTDQLTSCDGQIVSLNRVVAEREEQITDLNRAVAKREEQIMSLNRVVAEREEQIMSLNRVVAERDSLKHMHKVARTNMQLLTSSWSWRITKPLRSVGMFAFKVSWCLEQFGSARHNYGTLVALRRSVSFVKLKALKISARITKNVVPKCEVQEPAEVQLETRRVTSSHASAKQIIGSVFMLVDSFHDGGVERVVIDLCMQLKELGWGCKILVARDGGRSALEARAQGIEVVEFNQSHEAVRNFISRNRKGIVLAHHCYFALEAFSAEGMKIVEVLHNAYHWQKGSEDICRIREQYIARFVAVSEFVKMYSVNELNINWNSVSVVNNGLSAFGLIRPPLTVLCTKRLQTYSEPILLHVANLHPQKNHRLVVNAFASINRVYPRSRLVIAGSMDGYPNLRKTLHADIERLGIRDSIEFVGVLGRRELSKVMARAHIGLLPSILEGFSIATLEFSFFGLPSVLSATGASEELKRSYGHVEIAEGCALPPEELGVGAIDSALISLPSAVVVNLSSAILRVLENYPDYINKANTAGENFSEYAIEHTGAEYHRILLSLEEEGDLRATAK